MECRCRQNVHVQSARAVHWAAVGVGALWLRLLSYIQLLVASRTVEQYGWWFCRDTSTVVSTRQHGLEQFYLPLQHLAVYSIFFTTGYFSAVSCFVSSIRWRILSRRLRVGHPCLQLHACVHGLAPLLFTSYFMSLQIEKNVCSECYFPSLAGSCQQCPQRQARFLDRKCENWH